MRFPEKAALLGLAILAGAGCAGREGVRPNVVLIVIDTLRADRLGCYGCPVPTSPAIDALANEGVLFPRAYSTTSWTGPAIASMLTGLYPSSHGLTRFTHRLPDDLATITTILKDAGWATGAVVSGNFVTTEQGFHRGFDRWDESEVAGADHVSTEGVTAQAIELMRGFGEGPFFLFVHYFDPHYDYRRHAQYGLVSADAGSIEQGQDIWALRAALPDLTGEEMRYLRQTYDEEIRHTDAGVGELLRELERLGLDGRTLVILTSDHGEEFGERGWLGHTVSLHEELLRVPLVIRRPSSSAARGVATGTVSTMAIAPTVLTEVGIDPAAIAPQAGSLTPALDGVRSGDGEVFAEVTVRAKRKRTRKRALVRDRYKIIEDRIGKSYELFDLARDPFEAVDVKRRDAGVFREMREALDAAADRAAERDTEAEEGATSPETLEKLRSLGYVEGGE